MRKKKFNPDWQLRVNAIRSGAMDAIRSIRAGQIDDEQLDMLQNFVLFSVALMELEGPEKWALAKLNAEILSITNTK